VQPTKIGPDSWTHEACVDWDERFGKGSCDAGRIGRALRPLVKAHGWAAVRPVWRTYLEEKDPTFASPQDFKAKFTAWSDGAAGGDSVDAHNRRVLRSFMDPKPKTLLPGGA